MQSQDQAIRTEVERIVKANKKVTNKEIAAKLKDKGIKSKRGTPLKASSVPYYRQKRAKSRRSGGTLPPTSNVAAAISTLAEMLPKDERRDVGIRLLASVALS